MLEIAFLCENFVQVFSYSHVAKHEFVTHKRVHIE